MFPHNIFKKATFFRSEIKTVAIIKLLSLSLLMLPSILLSYLSFLETLDNGRNNLRDINHFTRGEFYELGCLRRHTTF